jgi:O-succinylbenzoic acid--CoA ligase
MLFWVHGAAGKHPDRVAIECGERAVTYLELGRLASDGWAALDSQGFRAGDQVALEIEDRFEFALAVHACLAAGTPVLPIDLRLAEDERAVRRLGASLIARNWPLWEGGAPPRARAARSAESVATVMHTSGTTSAPKRVELTYGNWVANATGSAVALGLDQAERWLCPMPLTHVGGLSILIRSVIYATTAVLHQRYDTEAVLAELMSPARRITMVSLVPTMLSRLLDAGLEAPPTLRWALVGGAPIPRSLVERAAAARVPIAPTYGMTEACSQIATFGFPLPGVDLMLDSADREVLVRGPMVAPGSLGADGWLHTGDLGRTDDRGRLEIVGRKSNTIISGGENVAPEEVEAVLDEHPDVSEAAVIGRPDPEWGEALVALVVPADGVALDSDGLRQHCLARLASFKVPKRFEQVRALPRTNSGKLLRRELG